MFPIILITTWHTAIHLMHLGDWATRISPGRFAVTPAVPRPGPIVILFRHFAGMAWAVRHGYECAAGGHAWLCTPSQIPR